MNQCFRILIEFRFPAKVTFKKASKSYKKTYTCKVTVKNPSLTAADAATVAVGSTVSVKAAKAWPTTATVTYVSDKPEIATVDATTGEVTGVAAGEATITATLVCGTKTRTATTKVTVEDDKALTITAEATAADTITATLSREVAADATVSVTKAGLTTAVSGTPTISGTTVTFKGTANLTAGTYTITVTEGEISASADVTVQNEYVKEIVITSTQALTNADVNNGHVAGSEAYIYYDVLNQYGESLRNSTTLSWTTSAGTPAVDKASGKLTVVNGTGTQAFTYGTEIYVTGVYTKTGASVNTSVKVGLAQALDTVEAVGFVNVNAPTTLLTTIPTDFTQATYRLLYLTYDQDGNVLPAATNNISGTKVTLISDAPLLIKSTFVDGEIFTINGVQYSSVKIEPGQYVDKGGEVNITAISNKTGTKKVTNFVVGAGALLQSLTLQTPSVVVANGDTNVTIPYTAKDTNGNDVTNYETIVRSSNTLNLSVTRGTLTIDEADDGTAVIKWNDASNPPSYTAGDFADSDGVDIPVSLTTVVVGGTSSNLMFDLKDTRVPVAIESININNNADALVASDKQDVNFFSDQVSYVDQYGSAMKGSVAANFFTYAKGSKYGQGADAAYYGVKADFADAKTYFNNNDIVVTSGDAVLKLDANDQSNVVNDTVQYSIVANATSSSATDSHWEVAGKVKSISYTIVPVGKLSNIAFGAIAKQQLVSGLETYTNGVAAGLKEKAGTSDLELANNTTTVPAGKKIKTQGTVSVSGTYSGKTLSVPSTLYTVDQSELVLADGKLDSVSGSAIKYSELYDSNTAKLTRKDAVKILKGTVTDADSNKVADISTKVVISDAPSVATTIKLAETATVNAEKTDLVLSTYSKFVLNGAGSTLVVLDQYEKPYSGVTLSYKVSDATENTGAFAHKLNSFAVQGNGSATTKLVGAELGDTFTLTIEATDNNVSSITLSAVCKVTVGSDVYAIITDSTDTDKTLRTILGYDR